jgi:hypothetical protein
VRAVFNSRIEGNFRKNPLQRVSFLTAATQILKPMDAKWLAHAGQDAATYGDLRRRG